MKFFKEIMFIVIGLNMNSIIDDIVVTFIIIVVVNISILDIVVQIVIILKTNWLKLRSWRRPRWN